MMSLFQSLFFSFLFFLVTQTNSFKTNLKLNSTITFIGGSKVFYGYYRSDKDGFINLITQQAELMNLKVVSLGFQNATISNIIERFHDIILDVPTSTKPVGSLIPNEMNEDSKSLSSSSSSSVGKDNNNNNNDSSTVILMVGDDDILTYGNSIINNEITLNNFLSSFSHDLQTIIALSQELNIKLIFSSPTIYGEKYDSSNSFDEIFEEITGIMRGIAQSHKETVLGVIDIRMAMLKYLERVNFHNTPMSSSLTYDGHHLNEDGHTFLAIAFCNALGIPIEETIKSDTATAIPIDVAVDVEGIQDSSDNGNDNGIGIGRRLRRLDDSNINMKLLRREEIEDKERRLLLNFDDEASFEDTS